MTAFRNLAQADHCLTVKQMDSQSWWILRTDLPGHGRRSSTPRVVFFANSEEQVKEWLAARTEPHYLQY
jgi:hypothetical protein